MSHNFIYRKLSEAIERKAYLSGVKLVKINSAFTSILGLLKYKDMYSLNRHTAAALVIARRGIGIKEKQAFSVKEKTDKPEKSDKDILKLEARDMSIDLTRKAWSWMQEGFLLQKPATLTGSCLEPSEKAYSTSTGEVPVSESVGTTGHYGNYEKLIRSKKGDLQNKECKIFQVL